MKVSTRSLVIVLGLVLGGAALAWGQVPPAPPAEFPYTGNRTGVWIVAHLSTERLLSVHSLALVSPSIIDY